MTTWFEPDWVTLDSTAQSPVRSRAGNFLIRLKVYTTSLADIGDPLLNLTPLRMVNVSVLLPFPHFQELASMGVVCPLCSAFW